MHLKSRLCKRTKQKGIPGLSHIGCDYQQSPRPVSEIRWIDHRYTAFTSGQLCVAFARDVRNSN